MILFAIALQAAALSNKHDDRAEFEKFWQEQAKAAAPELPKKLAWLWWVWTNGQFTLGYCSSYIPSDKMETMRHFPQENELMESAMGRHLLNSSTASFKEGMVYRSEVKPTAKLCEKELAYSAELLTKATGD